MASGSSAMRSISLSRASLSSKSQSKRAAQRAPEPAGEQRTKGRSRVGRLSRTFHVRDSLDRPITMFLHVQSALENAPRDHDHGECTRSTAVAISTQDVTDSLDVLTAYQISWKILSCQI